MKWIFYRFGRFALSAAALLLFACTEEEPKTLAGGWSNTETGSSLTGRVTDEEGRAASGAVIRLRPEDYLANDTVDRESAGASPSRGSIRDAVCDSDGVYLLESVRPGAYALEAQVEGRRGSLTRIKVEGGSETHTPILSPTRPIGRITGRARFSDGSFGSILVRVYGLERAVVTDAEGRFSFGSVPEGGYILHYSSPDPFAIPADRDGIRVASGGETDAGEILLRRTLRQGFQVADGSLELPGVDSTNPVIFENGTFINPLDGAYLWAKASLGSLDLRGTIVSYSSDTGEAHLSTNLLNCSRLIRLARISGMRNLADPIPGATRKLRAPVSGSRNNLMPEATAGTDLIIREGRKATPEKPLVLICGATMTTVATALLLEPSLADRLVVFGAHNATSNAEDSLALEIVARQARLVEWGREYNWNNSPSLYRSPSTYLANGFGQLVARHASYDTTEPLWSHAFYGDFGPATFLFQRRVWRTGRAVEYAGSPLLAKPTTGPLFDFVDIPDESNDWAAMQAEFLTTLNHPSAYHAWSLADGLEGESYARGADVKFDTTYQDASGESAQWTRGGAWAEYAFEAEARGNYSFGIRYRSVGAASVTLFTPNSSLPLALPASGFTAWGNAQGTLRLEAGHQVLRVESAGGSFHIDRINFRRN